MTATKRNFTVDIARIIAAFGVIAIHTPSGTKPATEVGLFFSPLCVPFFFIVSLTYFVAGLNKNNSHQDLLKKSWHRIVVPYLTWTVIYLLLMIVKGKVTGSQHLITLRFLLEAFFYGSGTLHLYFLPQLIVLQCLAFGCFFLLMGKGASKVNAAVILLLTVLYIIIGNIFDVYGITRTSRILFYMVAAFCLSGQIKKPSFNIIYVVAGLLLSMVAAVSLFFPISNVYLNFFFHLPIGGLGILLITIGWPARGLSRPLSLICSASYGVYLNHVIFVEGFQFIFKKFHINFSYDMFFKILMAGIVFTCSVLLTLVLRKSKLTARLFLGE